jgi:hypothetical protein
MRPVRHLTGFILALSVLAALFFGAGWGTAEIAGLNGAASGLGPALTSTHGLIAVGVVAAVGVLLGLAMAGPSISPLAAGLPGLVLLGWSAVMVADSSYTLRYLPLRHSPFTSGTTFLLLHGILALAGAAMIIPLFIPSRWRGRDGYVEEDEDFSVPAALGLVP